MLILKLLFLLLVGILLSGLWFVLVMLVSSFATKNGSKLLSHLVSSFLFSLLVGFVFVRTCFIGFTMLAHFCERFLSTTLRKRFVLRKE